MSFLYLDYETRSDIDLKKSGVYPYVESPRFDALMCAWGIDDDPIQVALGREEILRIPGLTSAKIQKVAHNAQFERIVTSRLLGMPTGKYLDPNHWTDTAAMAAAAGRPRDLDGCARSLGGELKDTAGTALIRLFCVPNRKGEFNRPEDYPAEWEKFIEYCRQDVVTLRDVHRKLPEMHELEQRIFLTDQIINDRGIAVDLDLARAAIIAGDENQLALETEVTQRTGIKNPSSRDQVLKWLRESGLKVRDLTADTVTALLGRDDLTDEQRFLLDTRKELALSASKKYTAAIAQSCSDGRARGGFLYHGAHTGRWTGRGIQLQNLPRAALENDTQVLAAILDLKMDNGADAHTLKALVRSMFVGPMTVADYSSIEARVIAWLAGEQWVLDAARAGRDLYVETAERMGHGMTRRDGKIAVLALGYAGGIGSLRAMGAEDDDEHLAFLVTQWREASPAIVGFWKTLERAFWNGGVAGRIRVDKDGDARRVILPSGRAITYHAVRRSQTGAWADGTPKTRLSYLDPRRARLETYGGRLAENVTQAVARDLLGTALINLETAGYRTVGHIHDEVLVEGEDLAGVSYHMTRLPRWAAGLPLDAAGFVTDRYKKG